MSAPATTSSAAADLPPLLPGDLWKQELSRAIRTADELIDLLGLPESLREGARRAATEFPVVVPRSYAARMQRGNPEDPLLLQVLPTLHETESPATFTEDAVGDLAARKAPGLLVKYAGRGLLITTGTCAIHCRYCFRRHYPYGDDPRSLDEWQPALEEIRRDSLLREILLSGGDPLVLSDNRLAALIDQLEQIPHLRRLRIHSRLPIVLPSRVTEELISRLTGSRLTPLLVVHANHPRELSGDCGEALRRLVRGGITVLNQAVLLRGINDDVETQAALSESLIDLGVLPYYLHQLDRVSGTAHFEVERRRGLEIVQALRGRLPGYAVPQYVEEIAGETSKTPIIG